MKKLEGNRKDWIKNILIVFLVILLLLTFFSNTIMNYSLAEVSSTYITNGSISTAIRGTGTIQSVDPYNVTISEGRKVESVKIKKGDTVAKGDVLFVLEEGDSTEVTEAKKAYQTLLEQYDTTIIDNQISSDVITAAKNKDEDVLAQKTALLEQRTALLKQKKDALDAIDAQISVTGATVVDTKAEEAQLEAANTALQAAKDALDKVNELQTKIDAYLSEAAQITDDETKKWELIDKAVALGNERDAIGDAATLTANIKAYENQITSINKTIEEKKKQGLYIFIQGTAKERLQQQPVLHSEPQAEG